MTDKKTSNELTSLEDVVALIQKSAGYMFSTENAARIIQYLRHPPQPPATSDANPHYMRAIASRIDSDVLPETSLERRVAASLRAAADIIQGRLAQPTEPVVMKWRAEMEAGAGFEFTMGDQFGPLLRGHRFVIHPLDSEGIEAMRSLKRASETKRTVQPDERIAVDGDYYGIDRSV